MALLNILEFPDERLRTKAAVVKDVDDSVRQIVDDLFETMYEAAGVGLAATQVDIHRQIIVLDVSEEKDAPFCLINPKISHKEGVEESEEGCLSVPGFFEKIRRAESINVSALGRDGKIFDMQVEGLLAVCIQHEMDHLKGKLFVDYLSPLKRQRIRKKLEKARRLDRGSSKSTRKAL